MALACAVSVTALPARAQSWGVFWEYQPRHKPKPRSKPPQLEHANKEPFGKIPQGPLQIIISIDQQKLHLYSDGSEVADTLIATGVPSHPTPVGVFSVIEKNRLHHSNIYSGAPMPYMQRITWSGVALHEGVNLGHPASHGCIRMPHDFATKLWVLTKLGARVIIARPELRPADFTDPHLFAHKESPPPTVPTTAAPQVEKPIKTAQTVDDGKAIDVAGIKPDEGAGHAQHAAKDASNAAPGDLAPITKPNGVASDIVLRDTISADAPAHDTDDPIAVGAGEAAPTDKPSAAEAALEAPVSMPPPRPADITRAAANVPISIFISRKDKKIYVRRDFLPLFDAPITIANPDQYFGTHVFTAMEYLDDHSSFRWNVVSLPAEPPRPSSRTTRAAVVGSGKHRNERVAPAPVPAPLTPQEVLARIEIPPEVVERISQLIIPGSSLIISDQGLGGETGRGTDFIVVMR